MNRPSSPASPAVKTPVRNRKARPVGTTGRRSVGRHRRTRTRPQINVSKINVPPEPHFDFSRTEDDTGEAEIDDQVCASSFRISSDLTVYGIDGLVRQ